MLQERESVLEVQIVLLEVRRLVLEGLERGLVELSLVGQVVV